MRNPLFILTILINFNIFATNKDNSDNFVNNAWKGVKMGAQRSAWVFAPELAMLLKQTNPTKSYPEIFQLDPTKSSTQIFQNLKKEFLTKEKFWFFSHHMNGMLIKSFYTFTYIATVPKKTKEYFPDLCRDFPLFYWTPLAISIAGTDAGALPYFEGLKVKHLMINEPPPSLLETAKRACGYYKRGGLLTLNISFWNAMIFFKFNMEMQNYLKTQRPDQPLTIPEQLFAAFLSSGLQAAVTVPLINERTLRLQNKTEQPTFLQYTLASLKKGDVVSAYKGGGSKWFQLFVMGVFNIYAVNALNK